MWVLSDCRCRICNPTEGIMRLGLLLMTLAIALGIGAMGLRAAPLGGVDDVLGEAVLGQVAYEICKPLDDTSTISVCRPLTEDDDVDADDEDEDEDDDE
jgi:hypothetical protein